MDESPSSGAHSAGVECGSALLATTEEKVDSPEGSAKGKPSRSKRFFQSAVMGYSYQALSMLGGLWLTPFLLRHLGQRDYGLWLTTLQIVAYLALVDFGIIALLPRTVAYATGRAGGVQKATDLPNIIEQTAVIVVGQTVLVAVAAALCWLFLPRQWVELRGPLTMILIAFVALFPFRIFAAVLEGLQEQAFVFRASIVSWAIGLLSNVLLILAGYGLYSIAAGWVISQLWSASACGYRLRKQYRELLPTQLPKLSKLELVGQLGRGFWISMNQIGQLLMAGSDVLVISRMLGPAMVVPYVCTGKLASTLANQPVIFMHLATPGLSEMKTGTSKNDLYRVMLALGQGMLLLTGLMFCVILVTNQGFVKWWVGGKQYAGLNLTFLVLLLMALRHWSLTFAYSAFAFGYEKILAVAGLLDGLVTAGVMLLLVSRFGYVGVVAGSIVGVCLVSLPVTMITVSRELGLSVRQMLRPIWPWFWRFALLAAGGMLLARHWVPSSPLQLIAAGAGTCAVYCAVLLRPILASPLGPYLESKIEALREMLPASPRG